MNKFAQFVVAWLAGRRDEDVAAEFGLVKNSIRNWRMGVHFPPDSRVDHLAPIFGISSAALRLMIAESRAQRRNQRRAAHRSHQLARP